MKNAAWFMLAVRLLRTMGLTTPLIRRLPITSAMVYLAVGILVGPMVPGLFHFNLLEESTLLEVLTEAAVLIALFAAGVKMPVPVTFVRCCAPVLLDNFLGLVLIRVVYGLSLLFSAWGFLVVFFAAVALRQTELELAGVAPYLPQRLQTDVLGATDDSAPTHHVCEASLVFKEHLDRLWELVLILLIGGTLFLDSWSWRAVGFALFLFTIARPLSVVTSLLGTRTPWRILGTAGWLGVRGIGSLCYLMYAIQHGFPEDLAVE